MKETRRLTRLCFPLGTIMMSGCGILTNGKGTRREYCEFSLDELQVRGPARLRPCRARSLSTALIFRLKVLSRQGCPPTRHSVCKSGGFRSSCWLAMCDGDLRPVACPLGQLFLSCRV